MSSSNRGGRDNTDQMAQILHAFGDLPPIQGSRRNRAIYTWWVANIMPLNHEEKS